MPTHKILDRTGDTRHSFDIADQAGVAEAERRFKELTGQGFLAFEPGQNGEPGQKLKVFKPEADIVFTPQRVGG